VSGLFDGLIGNSREVELLERELATPTQAYLFTGPDSVGKTSFAKRFAAGLLCPQSGEHDADCRSCRLALALTHPDLTVVEPEGATSIGVDQARSLVGRAAMAPIESSRTVFLLPEASAMTDQASNALLKTLEEPLAQVTFLLIAESEDDFPATVGSRCRTIHMGRVPTPELVQALIHRGVADDMAESVAAVAGGRPGLALSLMTRPEVANFRKMWLEIPTRVTPHPGDGQRLASVVIEELGPLVAKSIVPEMSKEMQERARRRIEQSLLVNGLEILASWYADSASLQMGGPIRNLDLSLNVLTEVTPRQAVLSADAALDAVVDIQSNLRRELVLANLFSRLGSA
jgi:DNA polymerase III delta' subunit